MLLISPFLLTLPVHKMKSLSSKVHLIQISKAFNYTHSHNETLRNIHIPRDVSQVTHYCLINGYQQLNLFYSLPYRLGVRNSSFIANRTILNRSACYLLHAGFFFFCLAHSSTMEMEKICFSAVSVDFQQITCRYIPEDRTLHNHRYENLKSYRTILVYNNMTRSVLANRIEE
jgi:hypothetical protein